MKWLLALACLALAVLLFGVGRAGRQPSSARAWAQMNWAMAMAPLFIVLCMVTSYGRMDQVRVALTGVSADRRALQTDGPSSPSAPAGGLARWSVGGGQGNDRPLDDVISSGLPPALITAGETGGVLRVDARPLAGTADRVGVVSIGSKSSFRYLGARRIAPGDAFCLEHCDRGGRWLALAPDGGGLQEADSGQALLRFPVRPIFRKIEGIADWSASQRIYPLRDFGRPDARMGEQQSSEDLCGGRFLCVVDPVSHKPTPARSFLYRKGGPSLFWANGEQAWIVLLDPGASLRTADGQVFRPSRTEPILSLEPGAGTDEDSAGKAVSQQVSVWSVRYADADDPADEKAPPSRLVERRAMTLQLSGAGLTVGFKTPLVVAGNEIGEPPSATYRLSGETTGADLGSDSVARLDFPALGGATAQRTAGRLTLEGQTRRLDVVSEGGRIRLPFGREFRLGPAGASRTGARQAIFRAERLSPPWIMIALALLTTLVLGQLMPAAWRDNPTALMLLATLQLLLAIRWIVGLEGVFLDEALDWRAILVSNGIAYVALPTMLVAFGQMPGPAGQKGIGLAAFVLGAGLALKTMYLVSPSWRDLIAFDSILCMAAAGLALLAAVGLDRARAAAGVIAGFPPISWLISLIAWARMFGGSVAARLRLALVPGWAWVLGTAVLFRLGVGFFGVKERFSVPTPLAVSVVYLPWLIIGFAMLFHEAVRRPRWFHPWAAAGLMAAGVIGAPSLMSDNGFAIMVIPVTLWAVGLGRAAPEAAPISEPKPRRGKGPPVQAAPRPPTAFAGWIKRLQGMAPTLNRQAWRAPAVVIAGLLAVALLGPLVTRIGVTDETYRSAARADREDAALNLVRAHAVSDQLLLRFYTLFNPNLLSAAGTSEAEKLRVWSAYLDDYAASWSGRGYLQPSRFGPLSDTHLTDNVGAVHVMSPFGRLGAAGLLAMLAALAIACHRLAPPRPSEPGDWRRIAGLLALWSIFGAGAYMILANLQLTPFTGRNIYFLAAKSNSDLVEGMVLFLLAYWGLAARPVR